MFEQDYIMRLLVQFAAAIRRSMQKAASDSDLAGAIDLLEASIGECTDIDGAVLLSLAPESMVNVMKVSGTDSQLAEYIARSLLLESSYLCELGLMQKAEIRESQAYAIAKEFGFEVSLDMLTEEEWDQFFSETQLEA